MPDVIFYNSFTRPRQGRNHEYIDRDIDLSASRAANQVGAPSQPHRPRARRAGLSADCCLCWGGCRSPSLCVPSAQSKASTSGTGIGPYRYTAEGRGSGEVGVAGRLRGLCDAIVWCRSSRRRACPCTPWCWCSITSGRPSTWAPSSGPQRPPGSRRCVREGHVCAAVLVHGQACVERPPLTDRVTFGCV